MIPEGKIQEMADRAASTRRGEGISIKAAIAREVRKARIPANQWGEAFRRVGKCLSNHADVANSVPEKVS